MPRCWYRSKSRGAPEAGPTGAAASEAGRPCSVYCCGVRRSSVVRRSAVCCASIGLCCASILSVLCVDPLLCVNSLLPTRFKQLKSPKGVSRPGPGTDLLLFGLGSHGCDGPRVSASLSSDLSTYPDRLPSARARTRTRILTAALQLKARSWPRPESGWLGQWPIFDVRPALGGRGLPETGDASRTTLLMTYLPNFRCKTFTHDLPHSPTLLL